MNRKSLGVIVAGLLLTGAAEGALTVHDAMKDVVAPQTQAIWDVGNAALDDDGNPDASRVTAAQWQQVADAAGRLKDVSLALAMAEHPIAAAPGAKLDGEENGANAAQVQRLIDANPKAFAGHARTLAAAADGLVAAASDKDVAKLADISGTIDQDCEACHVQFWYPEQQAAQ